MGVYRDITIRIGEIEDWGGDVRPSVGAGADRQFIGAFRSRADAIATVELAGASSEPPTP